MNLLNQTPKLLISNPSLFEAADLDHADRPSCKLDFNFQNWNYIEARL
jgi:hypothetical protein